MQKQRHQNRLDFFRRRMMFTTSHVAHLLGHRNTATFREFERGERLPSLINAFRLGIILRVPVEFLFPDLYDDLKNDIRAEEE
jgi:DNA-binding XRE family transcriptional regulator